MHKTTQIYEPTVKLHEAIVLIMQFFLLFHLRQLVICQIRIKVLFIVS